MYTRSLTDRIKIQFEIIYENVQDFIYRHSLRTPLLMLAGVAAVMTLKNGKQSIAMIKSLNPMYKKYKSSYSTYGGYNSGRTMPYAGRSTIGGGYTAGGTYGSSASSFGGTNYGGAIGGAYNHPSTFGQTQPSFQSPGLRGSTTMGGGGYGNTMATTNSFGSGASSSQTLPGMFQSVTNVPSFSGQIETISAPDSPNMVMQVIGSPGQGKVLFIDAQGSMNAVFDSQMAQTAQQNGWAGIIVNGNVLNDPQWSTKFIGVKALNFAMQKGMGMVGQRGMAVNVNGVMVNPGMFVQADNTGIHISQSGSSSTSMGSPMMMNQQTQFRSNTQFGSNNSQYGSNTQYGSNSQYGQRINSYGTPGGSTMGGGMNNYGSSMTGGGMGMNSYGGSSYSSNARSGYGGGTTPYAPRTSTGYNRPTSSYSSYGSSSYGRKKPSKRTLMAMLLFICAIVWVLLGD